MIIRAKWMMIISKKMMMTISKKIMIIRMVQSEDDDNKNEGNRHALFLEAVLYPFHACSCMCYCLLMLEVSNTLSLSSRINTAGA
jgi:hypothetical protein